VRPHSGEAGTGNWRPCGENLVHPPRMARHLPPSSPTPLTAHSPNQSVAVTQARTRSSADISTPELPSQPHHLTIACVSSLSGPTICPSGAPAQWQTI
jgi:hypothetical protein